MQILFPPLLVKIARTAGGIFTECFLLSTSIDVHTEPIKINVSRASISNDTDWYTRFNVYVAVSTVQRTWVTK